MSATSPTFLIGLAATAAALSWAPSAAAQSQPDAARPAASGAPAAHSAEPTAPALVGKAGEGHDPFVRIDDPMLAPPPPPPQVLGSWRQALDLVRTRSPDLKSAYAQIEVARGRARMTLAGSLPKLNATGTLSHQMIVPQPSGNATDNFFPATVLTGRLDLVVPLISARNWYDYATARSSVEKVGLDAEDMERRIIAGLAEALVGVVTAERLAEVTRNNLAFALSTLELNKKRESLGAANAIDVLRAEQELALSRASVIAADEALRRARESLGQSLGYDMAWGIQPNVKLDDLRQDAQKTCRPGQDLEQRADIRALHAAEKIADRNVTSNSLAFLPTVNAQSAVVTSTNDYATGSLGPVAWSISGVLSWALYDGGLRYGEKQQNQSLRELAQQQTLDGQREARIQVTQAERAVDVARQSLEVAELGRRVADDSARLTRIRFVNGNGTSFDMIESQRRSREAEIDVTLKEFAVLRAQIIAFLALATCDI